MTRVTRFTGTLSMLLLVVNHRDFDRLEPLAAKRLAGVLSQAAVPHERLRDRAA